MSAVREAVAKRGNHPSFRVLRPSGCFWAVAIFSVVVFAAMTFLSFRIHVPA